MGKVDTGYINYCYYCRKPKVSMEHVPPKSLFDTSYQLESDLVRVPSCKKHNSKMSGHDEHFKHNLLLASGSDEVTELMPWKKFRSSVRSGMGQGRASLSQIKIMKFDNNILLPTVKIDMDLFDVMIDKITKGLHYYHAKKSIGSKKISWYYIDKDKLDNVENIWERLSHVSVQEEVFSYKYGITEDKENSIWFFLFYKNVLIGSVVI